MPCQLERIVRSRFGTEPAGPAQRALAQAVLGVALRAVSAPALAVALRPERASRAHLRTVIACPPGVAEAFAR